MRNLFYAIAFVQILSGCAAVSQDMVSASSIKPSELFPYSQSLVAFNQHSTGPVFKIFLGDGKYFVVAEPLIYEISGTRERIVVPAGFVTDLASVPDILNVFVSKLGPHTVGAIVHDFLYWDQSCERDEADKFLRLSMKEYDSDIGDQIKVYLAVSTAGGVAWNHNRNERNRGLLKIIPSKFLTNLPFNKKWADYRSELFQMGYRAPDFLNREHRRSYCNVLAAG